MDNKRIYKAYVSSNTSTPPIMDEFTKRDGKGKPLYDQMIISLSNVDFRIKDQAYFGLDFIVSRDYQYGGVGEISFSNLKTGKMFDFTYFLYIVYQSREVFLSKIKDGTTVRYGETIYFEKPFTLIAKSSYQVGKGSTCGGTIPYGDANEYSIIGVKITFPNLERKTVTVTLFDD